MNRERCRRNFFNLKFQPHEVRHLSCYDPALESEEWVVAALATMAMGDTNAVAFGQTAHLSLILRTGTFSLDDFISLKMRPSRKPLRAGLMIDDFVVLEEIEKEEFAEIKQRGKRTPGGELVDKVREAYNNAGLPRHPTKAVEQEEVGEFWGMKLDGRGGVVRPNLKRVVPLAAVILRVVKAKVSSVGLLEVLSGSLVSVFQVRRRLMANLHEVYAAQRGREKNEIVKLSPQLRQELLVSVALLALSVIDLRLKPSKYLVASDASSRAEAAVRAEVGQQRMRELQRHGLQKGLWSRLLSPAKAFQRERNLLEEAEELPDCTYEMHPLWEKLATSLQFEQFGPVVRRKGRQRINIGEVRAALEAEKKQGLEEFGSQVSLACLVKGRSASPALNKLFKKSIPYHIACNNRAHYGFLRSKGNPADDPTREAEVREPSREEPPWWDEIARGEFGQFDAFLKAGKVHPMQVAELPDPKELLPDAPVDWRTNSRLKQERGVAWRAKRSKEEERGGQRKSLAAGSAAEDELKPLESEEGQRARRVEAERAVEERGAEAEITEAERVQRMREAEGSRRETKSSQEASSQLHGQRAEAADKGTGTDWAKTLVAEFRADQFLFADRFSTLEEAMKEGGGLLDMFSGARGFAKAMIKVGCPWALCFDIKHHPSEDLLNAKTQRTLRLLLGSGAFVAMAAGPVCASFSTAITPAWRTTEYPGGRPDLTELQQAKVDLGHLQLAFVLDLVGRALHRGILLWIENPDGSWFWRQRGRLSWEPVLKKYGQTLGDFRLDQCRFGTAWRKRTRFRTNCHLAHQKVLCRCNKPHVVLRGRCKLRKKKFTKIAESYPRSLCSTLATAFAIDLGWLGERRKLDVNACSRFNGARIGEAKNPGPRRSRAPTRRPLDEFLLLEPETIRLRSRIWERFSDWVDGQFGGDAMRDFLSVPPLFVKLLEAYGRWLYDAGTPLHYYRQLLAHVQREHTMTKPFMSSAWAVATQWQLAEPLQHRTPLPEPILQAMISLCILWGWHRFGASLALAYYGIARVGEVLRCRRSDLLTPEDLLSEEQVIYMQVKRPKTRNRGATVQYITCNDAVATKFIGRVLGPLQPHETLFHLSPATFRKRWDRILSKLGVSELHRLTPGGIRGGGCISAHKRQVPIQDLMWRMRISHARTLGHYLQETTAASILPSLSDDSRQKIAILRGYMPFLVELLLSAQPS